MKTQKKVGSDRSGFVRYFQAPTRCSIWVKDKLVAYSNSIKHCNCFLKKYGGTYYPKNGNHQD